MIDKPLIEKKLRRIEDLLRELNGVEIATIEEFKKDKVLSLNNTLIHTSPWFPPPLRSGGNEAVEQRTPDSPLRFAAGRTRSSKQMPLRGTAQLPR